MSETDLMLGMASLALLSSSSAAEDRIGIYDVPRLLMMPPQVLTVQEKLANDATDDGVVMMQPPRVRESEWVKGQN
jgi:hypothetical protein